MYIEATEELCRPRGFLLRFGMDLLEKDPYPVIIEDDGNSSKKYF